MNRAIEIEVLRKRLEGKQGPQYWRSLEELAGTQEFQDYLHHEFPENVEEWLDPVTRRGFLKLMGASFALAGLTACTRQPVEKIIPYVKQPEDIIAGLPLFFATAVTLGGYANGVLVESHEGRPTKIEGNPDHPASLGATDIYGQASVLGLYDPDRSQSISNIGNISSWGDLLTVLQARMATEKGRSNPGSGLRILTETISSPTLAAQMKDLLTAFPGAKWHQYDPAGRDEVRRGSKLAFGEFVETKYCFDKADVIVSLDSDFLGGGPGSLRYTRDFILHRKAEKMNRLYAIESTMTNTGAVADHRFPVRSSDIANIARALLGGSGDSAHPWLNAVAKDLTDHRGAGIVIVGDHQPAEVHALAHAINASLGNAGQTVLYTDTVEANPEDQLESMRALVLDMNAGRVETLVILGGNPVYNAPADFQFAANLSKVPLRIRLGLYEDETSDLCHWQIPETHSLESWSDARAFDGTATIMQPLIAPLYDGCKSPHELVAVLMGNTDKTAHDLVRDYWKKQNGDPNFEHFWRKSLNDGFVEGTAFAAKSVAVQSIISAVSKSSEGLELIFRADPTVHDGRYANLGWLQELPKPLTKLTWDNAAMVSPALAEKMSLQTNDVVELQVGGQKIQAPVWILPGQAADSVTIHLGYGRSRAGHVGSGIGFNAYALRTSKALWSANGVTVSKTGDKFELATTQHHALMEGRDLVRSFDAGHIEHEHHEHPDISLYAPWDYSKGYSWGMAVDLNACVGCNACVVACVSENNTPVVGKTEVIHGRAMHWIRIDRYFEGSMDNPKVHHQPVMCQHCEDAPCEVVCPVNATTHSPEGLNEMVYNRCVGTRYCSNNCPYKVRRFNFFLYSDIKTPSLKMMRNPDVTVRTRGVMEKCSYCVQRINRVKIESEKADRLIQDGEIKTACQQACPAEAIIFGNINDKNSRVSKMKADERSYGILTELNTRPRTTYMANLRNPNPALGTTKTQSHE